MSQKQPKTQILITDIPKNSFDSKWPTELEKQLFEVKFPNLKSKLQYYTPLAFLNRIVIIFDDEATAIEVYEYLKTFLKETGKDVKLYLAESLLAKSRSKSVDDAESGSPLNLSSSENVENEKPILSIDTNPSNTGVNSSSLSLGSPSLSPDRNGLESPTLLKFENQSKLHYYKEPLPRFAKSKSQTSLRSNDNTTYLFKPGTQSAVGSSSLTPSSSNNLMEGTDFPPSSPSITLDEFTH